MHWHHHTAADIMARLDTSREGLSSAEAGRRLAEAGPNTIVEARRHSWLAALAAQFLDVPILLLLGAALVAGLIGDAVDTAVILAIVALNAVIGFTQEYRAERAVAALKAMTAETATVLRDGRLQQLPASGLVPGDIVQVTAGGVVPADLRLVEVASLRTNEAMLTGESVPVDKSAEALHAEDAAIAERSNILHKGSFVTRGRAIGIVVATACPRSSGAWPPSCATCGRCRRRCRGGSPGWAGSSRRWSSSSASSSSPPASCVAKAGCRCS
jgi:Ca2+-transporting ATPase